MVRKPAVVVPWLLLAASAVVAWKAAQGDFVGSDLFPMVFAAVLVVVGLGPLVFQKSRPRFGWNALPTLGAVALAVLGAVLHHRVLETRRATFERHASERWLGKSVPDVGYHRAWNVHEADGNTRMDLSKGTVLVNFWGTWCDPCVKEMPELDAAWKRHRDRGVAIVGLTTDFAPEPRPDLGAAESEIEQFLGRVPVDYPILLLPPSEFAEFGVESYPTTLWLEDGVVGAVSVGIEGTREFLGRLSGG